MRTFHGWIGCRAGISLLCAAGAWANPSSGGANSYQLSQGDTFSDIRDVQLTPDGRHAIYLQDLVEDEVDALWSVRLAGGAPELLHALVAGEDIFKFQVSPNSQRVVYVVYQGVLGVRELRSIEISDPPGTSTQLNPALVSGGEVEDDFLISPDSGRVVYRADQETDEVFELWSVPIGGGAATKLNPPLVANGDVTGSDSFSISADGSRVVYRADQEVNDDFELWSVPIAGGAVTKLNPSLVSGGDVSFGNGIRISPAGSRVVYIADQEVDQMRELWSVPIAGGTATRLNPTLVTGGSISQFFISPDSGRVVYKGDQEADDQPELYSVPLLGGVAVRLTTLADKSFSVSDVTISPDSSRVVYISDQASLNVFEVFSNLLTGPTGAWTKLSPTLIPGGDVAIESLALSPDGSRVIYVADQLVDNVMEIFSVPILGGASLRLNPTLVANGDVSSFPGPVISPDGSRAIYQADQVTNDMLEIWSVPIGGGTSERVNGPLVAGGNTILQPAPDVAANSRDVLYLADELSLGQVELYVGDRCLFCDGFDAGESARWSLTTP